MTLRVLYIKGKLRGLGILLSLGDSLNYRMRFSTWASSTPSRHIHLLLLGTFNIDGFGLSISLIHLIVMSHKISEKPMVLGTRFLLLPSREIGFTGSLRLQINFLIPLVNWNQTALLFTILVYEFCYSANL